MMFVDTDKNFLTQDRLGPVVTLLKCNKKKSYSDECGYSLCCYQIRTLPHLLLQAFKLKTIHTALSISNLVYWDNPSAFPFSYH